jgi:hypothetical protein
LTDTLEELEARREKKYFEYINSDWEMGPQYRRELAEIELQISNTRRAIDTQSVP